MKQTLILFISNWFCTRVTKCLAFIDFSLCIVWHSLRVSVLLCVAQSKWWLWNDLCYNIDWSTRSNQFVTESGYVTSVRGHRGRICTHFKIIYILHVFAFECVTFKDDVRSVISRHSDNNLLLRGLPTKTHFTDSVVAWKDWRDSNPYPRSLKSTLLIMQ